MSNIAGRYGYSFQTIGIDQIKAHYLFTEEDSRILKTLLPVAKESFSQMTEAFYEFIFRFEHAKMFLNSDDIINKHRRGIEKWYLNLFNGVYDNAYFESLATISETHVKVGLPSHYVNAAFSFVRQFLEKYLINNGYTQALLSMHKIIDINLDILSLTYKQESQQELIKNVAMLKEAVKTKGIIPYIQPIYENRTGKLSHYESLMRICSAKNKTLCSILPLIQLAKQIMLYQDLMVQMVQKTFETFASLPYTFAINIGFEDISNADFRQFLDSQLRTFPDPQRVMFEILESDKITDYAIVSTFISNVRAYGCSIAIDDFGAGYSNMDNILKLKPDFLKIDGSLIENVDQSTHALKLVRNIINLSRDIGAQTIAEHVHNQAVYETLHAMEIDYLQGFYLAEPFPLSELPKRRAAE